VFGGYSGEAFSSELWVLNVFPQSAPTSPNTQMQALQESQQSSSTSSDSSDADENVLVWERPVVLSNAQGIVESITPREAHTLTFVPRKNILVLFGGYTKDGTTSDDLFVFDIAAQSWSRVGGGAESAGSAGSVSG